MTKHDGTHSDACFKAEAEIDRLRAENERLRAALEPFADFASVDYWEEYPDDHIINTWFKVVDGVPTKRQITVGDCRSAAAALEVKHD